MIWAGTLAIALALLFDWKGVGPKWIGDRIAALLVLFAGTVFLTGTLAAHWLVSLGQTIASWLAGIAAHFLNTQAATAVGQYLVPMVVLVVSVMWIAAMLPAKHAAKYAGDIASREMSSAMIWAGGAVITIGTTLIPGQLGNGVRAVMGLAVTAGATLIGTVS